MIVGIIIIAVVIVAIGILAWKLHKKEKTSQEEVINKPVSEPSTPPTDEVPKEEEKEPEKPKEEVIEHKFEVGDWVVWDNKISCHIDNIYQGKESLMYRITDVHNMTRDYSVKGFDNNAHLWTIKDAKDGDVLVASDGSIFLFKSTINGACKHYVALTTDNVINFNEGLEHYWETSTAVHPATKEQRDILLKAMADAGYAFDFEKKELKKIVKPQVPPVEEPKEEQKDEEPVLQEHAPTIKETSQKKLDECIDAFNEFIEVPKFGTTYKFLKDIYNEALSQFANTSLFGLPLLYQKENFPNVCNIYGGKRDEGASFNSMMGWMFALLLMELKPKKRNQIGKIGYELGGYNYNSPTFGYEFKSCPNTARLVGSMVLAAMLGKKNPDLRVMSNELGGITYPNGLSYYLDLGLNHLKTADDIQKNVVSKSGFYVDFRQFMPSSAGPYDKNYKSRPANIMSDEKDEYLNTKMDRDIHEYIVKTFNLDATDPAIHQRVVQAIADKEQSVNHLFGSNKKVGEYQFHPVFGKDTIGKKLKTDGGVANLAWSIQAIATYFRLILQNKIDSPAYYGRLRPGCDWTEEKKKNSSTDDRRNILVDITIEDNDGEKESSFGYYNSDGIWVHTQVERGKFAEEQKNHLGANSYPSGHSSGIWCVAMTLAELMPDKADLIMKEANEFAINRTVTRFHWTSDTIFGRVLGSVANIMCHATTDYATLLKIAKKEV